MASKGKCCRQRPISPNTDHWCKQVHKRVGSVLRLICLSLPESSVNFVRSQDLLQVIEQWNRSVDADEVSRVILHVGDIASCYDELDHNDCWMESPGHLARCRPGIAPRADPDEQSTGTPWTDGAETTSLLAQISQQTELGLS